MFWQILVIFKTSSWIYPSMNWDRAKSKPCKKTVGAETLGFYCICGPMVDAFIYLLYELLSTIYDRSLGKNQFQFYTDIPKPWSGFSSTPHTLPYLWKFALLQKTRKRQRPIFLCPPPQWPQEVSTISTEPFLSNEHNFE